MRYQLMMIMLLLSVSVFAQLTVECYDCSRLITESCSSCKSQLHYELFSGLKVVYRGETSWLDRPYRIYYEGDRVHLNDWEGDYVTFLLSELGQSRVELEDLIRRCNCPAKSFFLTAGASDTLADDRQGAAEVPLGDTIHYWSPDTTVEVTIAPDTRVALKLSKQFLDEIDKIDSLLQDHLRRDKDTSIYNERDTFVVEHQGLISHGDTIFTQWIFDSLAAHDLRIDANTRMIEMIKDTLIVHRHELNRLGREIITIKDTLVVHRREINQNHHLIIELFDSIRLHRVLADSLFYLDRIDFDKDSLNELDSFYLSDGRLIVHGDTIPLFDASTLQRLIDSLFVLDGLDHDKDSTNEYDSIWFAGQWLLSGDSIILRRCRQELCSTSILTAGTGFANVSWTLIGYNNPADNSLIPAAREITFGTNGNGGDGFSPNANFGDFEQALVDYYRYELGIDIDSIRHIPPTGFTRGFDLQVYSSDCEVIPANRRPIYRARSTFGSNIRSSTSGVTYGSTLVESCDCNSEISLCIADALEPVLELINDHIARDKDLSPDDELDTLYLEDGTEITHGDTIPVFDASGLKKLIDSLFYLDSLDHDKDSLNERDSFYILGQGWKKVGDSIEVSDSFYVIGSGWIKHLDTVGCMTTVLADFDLENTNQNIGTRNALSTTAGDIDGDGDQDLVFGYVNGVSELYVNDGTGTYSLSQTLTDGATRTSSHHFFDFDRDGDLDLVEAGEFTENGLYINDGTGHFTRRTDVVLDYMVSTPLGTSWTVSRSVTSGDFNGDGWLDLYFGNGYTENYVFLNDRMGGFEAAILLGPADKWTAEVAAVDIDRDGDLDLIDANRCVDRCTGQNFPSQENRIWLNNGSGSFVESSSKFGYGNTHGLAVVDVDRDGDFDLVTGNGESDVDGATDLSPYASSVWLNNGSGQFSISQELQIATNSTRAVALVDFDRDGDQDLYFGNADAPNEIFENEGGTFTLFKQLDLNDQSFGVNFVDVTGDGYADLVSANYNGPNSVYEFVPFFEEVMEAFACASDLAGIRQELEFLEGRVDQLSLGLNGNGDISAENELDSFYVQGYGWVHNGDTIKSGFYHMTEVVNGSDVPTQQITVGSLTFAGIRDDNQLKWIVKRSAESGAEPFSIMYSRPNTEVMEVSILPSFTFLDEGAELPQRLTITQLSASSTEMWTIEATAVDLGSDQYKFSFQIQYHN